METVLQIYTQVCYLKFKICLIQIIELSPLPRE